MGVKRGDVNHKVLDELLEDPEVESYQFVMKSVRDNGTRTLKELAGRVSEPDRPQCMTRRCEGRCSDKETPRRRRGLDTPGVRGGTQGHVSGLEHNIEVLTTALTESDQRYRTLQLRRALEGGADDGTDPLAAPQGPAWRRVLLTCLVMS